MPFEVGDYIKMINNDETYLVEKVEVIRLPAELETPDIEGDIARYHYDVKKLSTGQKSKVQIIVEIEPNNNVDIDGVTWNKYEQRGGDRKSKRRRQSKRRQSKGKRRGTKRRQTKGKRVRQ